MPLTSLTCVQFSFDLGFLSYTNFLNDRKKLSQFSHNVRKYKLVNIVTASLNTIYVAND